MGAPLADRRSSPLPSPSRSGGTTRFGPGGARAGSAFDYVAVGHLTVDLVMREDRWQCRPGGGAFYSALQAARLGCRTLLLTQGAEAELLPLITPHLSEIAVELIPSRRTTVLLTEGSGERRTQRLLSWAGPMRQLPAVNGEILHLAPVAAELPEQGLRADIDTRSHRFIAITPQGLLRTWPRTGGLLRAASLPAGSLPPRFDAAVVSEAELPNCGPLRTAIARHHAVLAVTMGERPTQLFCDSELRSVPTVATREPIDDLGAGDVFSAAFFVSLAAGETPEQAARCGNVAAHLRIVGEGAGAVGRRETIEAALRAHVTASARSS